MKTYLKNNLGALLVVAVVVVLFSAGLLPVGLAGALGGMPFVVGETKSVEDILTAFEQFKTANDARLKEIETKGHADPLLSGKVDKANAAIEAALAKMEAETAEVKAIKARADALEATLQRINRGAVLGGQSLIEAKDLKAYTTFYGGGIDGVAENTYLEHKAALHVFIRKGDASKLLVFEQKAMSVDSQPDGGFFVMPDTTGRIVMKVFESSPMRQFANVQAIGTDALEGDYDLDEAGSGWVAERAARPENTTPQTGQWRIPANELYAEPRATQKLLDDSQVDPESWLAGKVASKFARDEATAFITGDGNGKPRGILTYPDGMPTKALWKVIERTKTGVNGDFAASNKGDIFIDVMGKMKEFYFNGSVVWAMNRTVRAAVRKFKDANGVYLLAFDFSGSPKQTLFGIPTAAFEDMPALATGSLSIALANFAEAYQIVDRIGIRVLRDPFTSKPFVKFYTTKRVGGDVINHEAIKLIEFSA